jgi:hypothetical protein
MGWLIVALFIGIGVGAFMTAYRRRLDVQTGPWIANELSQND